MDVSKIEFPDDWVTIGWSKDDNGVWFEMGYSPRVTADKPSDKEPEIPVHKVADMLNRGEIVTLVSNFVKSTWSEE